MTVLPAVLRLWMAVAAFQAEALEPGKEWQEASALLVEASAATQREDWDLVVESCTKGAQLYRQAGEPKGEAECLTFVGIAEEAKKNHQAAHQAWRAALQIYQRLGGHAYQEALIHSFLGISCEQVGRIEEAIHHLDTALGLFRQSGDQDKELTVLCRLGKLELQRGQSRKAAAHLEGALPLVRQGVAVSRHRSVCLHHLGVAYEALGRNPEARSILEEALELARIDGDREGAATTLSQLGPVYRSLGEYEKALSVLREAESFFLQSGETSLLWLTRLNVAVVLASTGRIEEARNLYEQAISYYRQTGEEKGLASCLTSLAAIVRGEGGGAEARRLYQEALTIRKRIGDRAGEASTLNNLALLEFMNGSLEQSLASFERSLAIRKEIGDRQGEAISLFNTSHVYADLGRFEESLARLEQARTLAREVGNPELEAMALEKTAQFLALAGRTKAALSQADEALAIARRIRNPRIELAITRTRGLILWDLRRPRKAWSAFSRARTLSRELDDPASEAEALLVLGSTMLDHDASTALGYAEESLELQDDHRLLFHRGWTLSLMGMAHERLKETEKAVAAYRQAVATEEDALEGIWTSDLLQRFEGIAGARLRLLELLSESGKSEEAFSLAEQGRARAFLSQMKDQGIDVRRSASRELIEEEAGLRRRLQDLKRQFQEERRKSLHQQDQALLASLPRRLDEVRRSYETLLIRLKQTNPEYADLVRPSPLTLPDVQRLLPEETTLIEYFVLPRKVLAWVIDRESHRLVQIPIPKGDLARRVALFRDRIKERGVEGGLAVALYRHLVEPLTPHVRHRKVILVPHGPLHSLPFAALLDGTGTRLVERYSLSRLPSASVLPFLLQKRSPNEGRLLVLGDPDRSLPSAAEEARAVASLYGTKPLLGGQAQERAVRDSSRRIDVLHIAAHARVDSARPLFSRIELAPGKGEDGDLEVHEVFGLDMAGVNLVVLSGCETALGDLTGGDDLMGWSRAFLYAGAPAVLATLWPVDDAASAALMTSFYRYLRQGKSASAALQAAQRETSARTAWKSPYSWAAFTLIGDPGEDLAADGAQ
jgi:CHAT domain-containing protein/tetratricopeptide (TPR) repeat protein